LETRGGRARIEEDDILTDTNILLRFIQFQDPHHDLIDRSVSILRRQGARFFVAHQNMREFRNVSARTVGQNGYGCLLNRPTRIRRAGKPCSVLPETPSVYGGEGSSKYDVSGTQARDANRFAIMRAHGLTRIPTFNVADSARYEEIAAVRPAEVG
jgi:hypothetical protein